MTIAPARNKGVWAGCVMSGLVVAFLLIDAVMKLIAPPMVTDSGAELGFAGVGAILLTGYLGGAVATQMRVHAPVFSTVLFGAYLGVLLWGGLWFRDARIRSLIPFRTHN